MSRVNHILKNIKFAFVSQTLLIITNFVVRKVFIDTLGEEYLGLSGLFGDILSMLSLAELGFGTSIVFSLYKPVAEKDTEKIKSLMQLYRRAYMLAGTVVLVAGFSLTPFLDFFVKEMPVGIPHIEWIYILNVINSGMSYFFIYKASLLFTDQKKYVEMIINMVVKAVLAVLQILILLFTKNYFLFLGMMTAALLIQNLMISWQTDKRYPYLKERFVRPLEQADKDVIKHNVGAMVFHKLGDVAVFSTDSILMAKFVSVAAVGLYSNYTMIRKALLNVIFLIFNGITSSMGNLNACESDERKAEAFHNLYFFSAWLFGFMSICLYILYNPFITLWLGEAYLFPVSTVFVIVVNFYMYSMRMPVGNTKEAMGLFWYDRYKPVVEAAINLVLSVILAKRMGIEGILWGTALSTVLVPFWIEPVVLYLYGLKRKPAQYFKKYFIYLSVTVLAGTGTGWLCSFSPDGMTGFIWKMFLCLLCPNLVYLFVYFRTKEFLYLKDIAGNILLNIANRFRKGV